MPENLSINRKKFSVETQPEIKREDNFKGKVPKIINYVY